jgi:hypothetical protein
MKAPISVRMLLALTTAVFLTAALANATGGQAAPWRLLQSSDGMLWVLADGIKHRISPDPWPDAARYGREQGTVFAHHSSYPAS